MGTDAALLANKVIENAYIVLSVELLALCQAVDFLHCQSKLASVSSKLYETIRQNFKAIKEDRDVTGEIQKIITVLKSIDI
jgi:histidine ammonia-lyase